MKSVSNYIGRLTRSAPVPALVHESTAEPTDDARPQPAEQPYTPLRGVSVIHTRNVTEGALTALVARKTAIREEIDRLVEEERQTIKAIEAQQAALNVLSSDISLFRA